MQVLRDDAPDDRVGPLVRALREATGFELEASLATLVSPMTDFLVPPAEALRCASGPTDTISAGQRRRWSATATAERPLPWPAPTAADAAAFHRDGNRTRWETAAFARQHRLTRAAVAAVLDPSSAALDQVVDGVVLLCEQTSWCWPAHDEVATRGEVLPDPDRPVLDLGAGGVAAQLAVVDALLGEDLDDAVPGVRARIRRETERRIFTPFLHRRDWHWIGRRGAVHNWNPWIHGDVLSAALRLVDGPGDADRRAAVVELCLRGLDVFLADLPADGAIDEGADYWWNGACRALEAVLLVEAAFGCPGGLVGRIPALVATVDFPRAMALGDRWTVSVADSCARSLVELPWHSLHRAALATGNDAAAALAVSRARADGLLTDDRFDLARVARALADRRWSNALDDPAPAAAAPLDARVWLPSIQLCIARGTSGETPADPGAPGLTLMVKGGHNAENHNHLDVGSVCIASAGVPVVVDPGRATYSATTFGPDRYSEWQVTSDWHNVPRVAGAGQSLGREATATAVAPLGNDGTQRVDAGGDVAGLALELSAVYPGSGVRSWRRRAQLDRTAESVVVDDEWEFGDDAPPGSTVLHWILAGTVESIPGGVRVTPVEPAPALVLRWPSSCPGQLEPRHLDDPMLRAVWGPTLTRLSIDVTTVSRCTLTVTGEPATGVRHV